MKKLLVVLILLFAGWTFIQAQTERGTVLIGSSTDIVGTNLSILPCVPNNVGLSFGSSKYKSDDANSEGTNYLSFSVAPKVGYFVIDKGVVGAALNFAYYKEEEMDKAYTSIAVEHFVRYYFSPGKFQAFVQGRAGLGQINYSSWEESFIMNYGADIGGSFFIDEAISLDLLVGYDHLKNKVKDAPSNARRVSDKFGFAVGFSWYL